jgi:hypothetical protein
LWYYVDLEVGTNISEELTTFRAKDGGTMFFEILVSTSNSTQYHNQKTTISIFTDVRISKHILQKSKFPEALCSL